MSTKPNAPKSPASLFEVTDRLEESFRRLNGLMNRMESEACSITERLQITIGIRQHIALAERSLAASTRAEAVNHFIEAAFEGSYNRKWNSHWQNPAEGCTSKIHYCARDCAKQKTPTR